jgi:hypothetical protein
VGFPKPPDDATEELATKVNGNRRAHYKKIAKQTGAPLKAVAAQAGKKLVAKVPKGQFYRNADDEWVEKR